MECAAAAADIGLVVGEPVAVAKIKRMVKYEEDQEYHFYLHNVGVELQGQPFGPETPKVGSGLLPDKGHLNGIRVKYV